MSDQETPLTPNARAIAFRRSSPAPATPAPPGLGDGSRTTKDSLRIDAIGDVDELNSSLGPALCEELPPVRAALLDIQHDLFRPRWRPLPTRHGHRRRMPRSPASKNWSTSSTATCPMLKGIHPAWWYLARRPLPIFTAICRRAGRLDGPPGIPPSRCPMPRAVSSTARPDLLFILGRQLNGPVVVATAVAERQERCLKAGQPPGHPVNVESCFASSPPTATGPRAPHHRK